VKIASKTRKYLAVSMDIKRAVRGHREFFARAHTDLFYEAAMCAFHEFRDEAEHHRREHLRTKINSMIRRLFWNREKDETASSRPPLQSVVINT